ncbi:MAG: LysR family transcriptional regulator substrate-binding protein, partial [Sulfobacillus sp.]
IAEMERPGQGELHIAAVATVAVFSLPQVLSVFTKNFPHLRVRVKIGEIQDNLDGVVKGEHAVGLVTVPIIHGQIDSIPLFSDPVRLVVSPQRARDLPSIITLQDVAEMEFISYQTPSRFRSYVDGVLEQHGVIPQILMEFNSHDVIKSMVKVGLGAAMVPDSVVREDIKRGELVALGVENLPSIARTTSLILLKDPPRTAALKALLATFITHYEVPSHLWPSWLGDS